MKNLKIIFIFFVFLIAIKSNAQQLETLLNEALSNSPTIQKFELQYEIKTEKVNEVNTIPNTEFGLGYFVSEPETRTGPQRFKISAKQMLPWFGSITARENYANSLANASFEDIVIAKRKLIASVSQAYFNLYANKAKQQVLIKNIELLKTYETLALTSVEVGKASAVDVLRLQMRQNELDQLKQLLHHKYIAEQTVINKLLNRDKGIVVTVENSLEIPSDNPFLNTNNLELHPELLKYEKLFNAVEKSELLNQKESNPLIGFGIDYINVQERSDITISDNGKDILMPMASLSIPLFNKKYKSKSKQNNLQQLAIKTEKQERFNKLQSILDVAVNEQISARISFNIQTKNLKQAKNAEEILIRSYETGTINFNDVLDIQELQLKFQMNQIESVKKYYNQSAIINYLIQ